MTLTLRVDAPSVRAGNLNVRAIGNSPLVCFSEIKKIGGKNKMGTSFEYSKTLCGEGSILLILGLVPYVGWVLGIIGVILLLRGVKELAIYYQDNEIYQNALTGVKFYIVALVAAAVAIAGMVIGIGTATDFKFNSNFTLTAGFGIGLAAFLGGIIIAFIFYVLAAMHLKKPSTRSRRKQENTRLPQLHAALVGIHTDYNRRRLYPDIPRLDICSSRLLHYESATTATIHFTAIWKHTACYTTFSTIVYSNTILLQLRSTNRIKRSTYCSHCGKEVS